MTRLAEALKKKMDEIDETGILPRLDYSLLDNPPIKLYLKACACLDVDPKEYLEDYM